MFYDSWVTARTVFLFLVLILLLLVSGTRHIMFAAEADERAANASVYLPLLSNGVQAQPQSGPPTIHFFQAAPSMINAGDTTTLSWNVTNATKVSIEGLGDMSGNSVRLQPTATTTYTMIVTNAFQSVVAKTTIIVNPVDAGSDTGAIWLPYQTEDNSVVNVRSTSMAVDPQGGIHGVYVINTVGDAGHFPVYYIYCPSACGDEAHWTRTRLSDRIEEARLRLDSAGHPRLMLFSNGETNPGDSGTYEYLYGECDSSCTDAANWTIVTLFTVQDNPIGYSDLNNRWFALDSQDHPAFLYEDLDSEHNGDYYHACSANCTNPANWSDTFVNHNVINYDLAFSPAGEPRFAALDVHDSLHTVKLGYYECNQDCSQWQGIWLGECGPFCGYSMALDGEGEPRIVFYTGNPSDLQVLEPQRMYYWWCSHDCGDYYHADWQPTLINTSPTHGMSNQLVIDPNGSPHLAYQLGDGGPGYLWCSANCTSATPTWAAKQIEDHSVLEQEFPNELNLHCSEQSWASGHRPSITLAPNGNIVLGFDVAHSYYGNDLDHPGEPCNPQDGNLLSTDIQLSRVAIFAQE